jgi:hypothetical protein
MKPVPVFKIANETGEDGKPKSEYPTFGCSVSLFFCLILGETTTFCFQMKP